MDDKKAVLDRIIEEGRSTALAVMEKIQTEIPQDRIVKAKAMTFEPDANGLFVKVPGVERETLHRNALQQVVERTDMGLDMARTLDVPGWKRELLAHNLNEFFSHIDSGSAETKLLTRSYKGQIRGVLSNKFRRLDSRPLLESAAKAFQAIGAVPIEGIGTDTRIAIKAVVPTIYEPAPGEFMAFGVSWQNSDYGNGAHALKLFLLRVRCANGATMDDLLREVHLGSRLTEEDLWSDRTYKLDTDRSASMLNDAIRGALSPAKVGELCATIARAASEKIDVNRMKEYLKKNLGVAGAKEVIETFNGAEVEMLPPGNTMWRLSNAISWLAGQTTDKDKSLDLSKLAGDVIKKAA